MTWIGSLSQEDPLEEGMTTQSSTLAWRISWTEVPNRLQFMGVTKNQMQLNQLSMHTQ